MLTEILLLIVSYLGFWVGIILGFIAPEELNSFFFKMFKVNTKIIYVIIPFLVIFSFKFQLLITSLCFLIGFPLGSIEVSKFTKGKKVKNKKKLILSCFKKTAFFFIASIFFILLSSFF